MPSDENSIFISYRRSVSKYIARSVFLALHYNGYDAFLDVENINSGTFESIILNQIAARPHFLVILTDGTLERCAEPGDWLRREIEFAIDLKRNIVPVLVDDFNFSTAPAYLTGKLSKLQEYNGLRLYYEYFDDGMNKLRNRFLKHPVNTEITPTPPEETKKVAEIIKEVAREQVPTPREIQAEVIFFRGLRKWTIGNLAGAVEDYDKAIRLNPHDFDVYTNRAVARTESGDIESALMDFDQAIRFAPREKLAAIYLNRGSVLADLGDIDGAIEDYDSAIRLNPEYTSAYFIRGNARYHKGDLDGAIVDYDRVVKLNRRFADVSYNRGMARYDLGDWEGAIADFTLSIRHRPNRYDAYFHRGLARQDGGDFKGAIADFTEAIRIKPQDINAYYQRSFVRYYVGDFIGVIEDCNWLLDHTQGNSSIYAQRGNAYMGKGEPDKAVTDYTHAIRLDAASLTAYNNRGEAFFVLRQYRKALADYKQAHNLSVGEPIVLGGLGVTFHALGDVVNAKRAWGRLRKQSPLYEYVAWVQHEFQWPAPQLEEAHKLLAKL